VSPPTAELRIAFRALRVAAGLQVPVGSPAPWVIPWSDIQMDKQALGSGGTALRRSGPSVAGTDGAHAQRLIAAQDSVPSTRARGSVYPSRSRRAARSTASA